MLGIGQAILIAAVIFIAIIYFGKKSPGVARQAGRSVSEFKQGLKDIPKAIEEVKEEIKS